MPEDGDAYLERWNAREYLRQYYSDAVPRDDVANTRFAVKHLQEARRRFGSALEFGSGPTVHHLSPLVPHVDDVTLADYVPENLAEAQKWVTREDGAFDWDRYLTGMLAVELDVHEDEARGGLEERKHLIRRAVKAVVPADILQSLPLGHAVQFDLVVSYYCLEALGLKREDWWRCVRKLCELVRPGGALLLGAMRNAVSYRVFEQEFAATPIDEGDLASELLRNGFDAASMHIETADVPEFRGHGYHAVCCAFATKKG